MRTTVAKDSRLALRKYSFYRSKIVNPISDTKCEYWPDGVLVVQNKKIVEILSYSDACSKYVEAFGNSNLHEFPQGVIVPAFFDMHFHWVQDDVRLMPKASLLEWLEKYTFPSEAKFKNKSYARKKAQHFFKRLVSVGTLGGACYSSVHDHALDEAMEAVVGDVLVGNVLMTQESPKSLQQTAVKAITAAKRGMKKYGNKYVLTPRFAIATDPHTMKETASQADKKKIFKQSHLSETPGEIDFVLGQYRGMKGFEKVKSYTEIYHKTGMLGPRSLMGHAIHVGPDELKLLKKTKTVLVHCPTSNAPIKERGLGSGLFDFKKTEKAGVRWALGSDIGGGPFLSMLDVMASFVAQNRRAKDSGATFIKALYRATLAGAEILGVDKRTGSLKRGKEANFVVLDCPKGAYKDAEGLLHALIGQTKKREHYDQKVRGTFWQDEALFLR